MIKRILVAASALLILTAAPAAAQYEEPFTVEVLGDTAVNPGGAITLAGTCTEADEVTVSLGGTVIATIPVAADDTYSGDVTIPAGTAPGTHTLTTTCGSQVASITITVLGAGTSPGGTGSGSGGELARTGGIELDPLLKTAGALLVLGAAAVLFASKRRQVA